MMRIQLVLAIVMLSSPAFAQPAVDCKKTETQAECHARLRCRADEEVAECQKRLRAAGSSNNGNNNSNSDNGRDNRGDRGRDDRGRNDRYNNDDGGRRQRGRSGSRRRRGGGGGGGGGGGSFQANKTFGIGLELGEPSGLNGKYFLSDTRALDFGLGYAYEHYYYGDGLHIYVDHLWHPTSLVSSPALELPLFIGVGGRFWDFEGCERRGPDLFCERGSAFGIRIPVGLSFDFNNAPIDIFVQLVPTIDVLFGDYYDRFNDRGHFGIDGSVGFRVWLK